MPVRKRQIEQAVLTPFKAAGWRKNGRSVDKAGVGVAGVVNVQASRFDGLQFVNVGFWFPESADEQVAYNKCPILFRLEELYPEYREELLKATAEDDGSEEALEWLRAFIAEAAEPRLSALLERESLRTALQSERLRGARVTLQARLALGL